MSNTTCTIVPLAGAYVSDAGALEAACFSDALTAGAFAEFIGRGECHYYAAVAAGGGFAGYGGFLIAADEAEILTVAVAPSYRRQGIARALLDRMLSDARAIGASSVFLEVRASNSAAAALYHTAGFSQCGVRKNYYTRPREDAVLMALHFCGKEEC